MTYVDGYLIPVKNENKEAYRAMAAMAAPVFIDHGAVHVMENWGDDVPRGKTTDFWMAVKAEDDESVVFSWITWPSKEARDKGNAAAMADERFKDIGGMELFDGKRIVFSGFQTIVEAKA